MRARERRVGVIVSAALLVAAWIVPPAAHAQGPAGRAWRGGWGSGLMLGVPLRSLNLTPDQQNQVQSILSTYRSSAHPIIQQLRQAQRSLADQLLAAGQLQGADLQPQLQQISQLRTQLLQLSAQAAMDIRNLLTSDQLASAAQTKDKLRDLRSQIYQLLDPGQQP